MPDPIQALLDSAEPALRYKARLLQTRGVLPEAEVASLREAVRSSERVSLLLSERRTDGSIALHPYSKWRGAHWVLAMLAELGYPAGDTSLIALREQVLDWLAPGHLRNLRVIDGRTRRCASVEGNAVWSLVTLGLADERVEALIEQLLAWQWPDGGWNCDKRPAAINSSFHESLIPMRALALYSRVTGSSAAAAAAERAADIFLKRHLYLRQRDGAVIDPDFIRLHYPAYWHYDILAGLKVLAEAGFIGDPRCAEALDLLERKRLPDGGFPAEGRHFSTAPSCRSGRSLVNWGPASAKRSNPFVTADALYVLQQAGRLP